MASGWMIESQKRKHFLAGWRLPVKNMKQPSAGKKLALLAFLLVVHSSHAATQAQEKAQEKTDQQPPTLRTQSNVVLVPALVKDPTGKLIFDLQTTDFVIEDNGVEQQVSMDEAEPQEFVSLVVAIQTGRTAVNEFKRMKGLATLLDQIAGQPQVETAIVTFDSEINLLQDFTFDSQQTEANLKKLKSGDEQGAAIYDAVSFSVNLLAKRPQDSRRVLLLISETRDHGSHAVKLDDAIAAISDSNAVVYTLAFSPTGSSALDTLRGDQTVRQNPGGGFVNFIQMIELARQAMRKNAAKSVASMTGGEYELFTSRKSFERFMTEFTNHLHSRYLLRFEPKDPKPGLHQVRLRLRRKGDYVILARSTYWVAEPETTGH
jgi:VWFA-related protein